MPNPAPGASSLAAAQAQTLEPGQSITRDLTGGELHSYGIALAVDQYLRVIVEQRGVDVTVTLVGADGTNHAEANTARGREGTETVNFIADAAGDYRIDVRVPAKNASGGRYQATLVERRVPTSGERSLEQARRLLAAASQLREKGKFDEALLPAAQGLAVRENVLGPDHPEVADALHLLAVIYDDKHDLTSAEPLNLRALAIRERAYGPEHPDVARSLFNLAWIRQNKDAAEAASLYRRVLDIQERALGPDHVDVATTLNDLAVLHNKRGDHDQGILLNQRVLAIREAALGPDSPGIAKALNNLARDYQNKGEYEKAASLFRRAVSIWEKALGPDHPEVAFALDGLASVNATSGDYAAAALYLRALAIREKALGPDHVEVGTTLNNLAVLYRQKGDYAKAEALHLRDLALTEKALGPDHPFVAPTLSNLARLYQERGEYDRARPLYRRALTIQEKSYGAAHSSVGLTMNRLGQLYVESTAGDPAEAEQLFQRALATLEKTVPDHPGVAASLTGLAALAAQRGDRSLAERYYQRALVIQEKAFGPDHIDVAQSVERLSALARSAGNAPQAVTLLSRAHDIRERHLAHNLPLGSERQKLSFLKLYADDTDVALTLHGRLAPRDPDALHLALTTLLRRKGRGLDATQDALAILRPRASQEDQELFGQLSRARSRLAALTLRGPAGTRAGVYASQLRQLEDLVDQIEADLSARSVAFRAQSTPITVEGVQAAMPLGTVLIEFARYRPAVDAAERSRVPRYAAYLLGPEIGPSWVDLGDAEEIDAAVDVWRQALRDPRRADARRLARVLDAMIMQPVRAYLGRSSHLLIAPEGELNLIPFAALVDEDSKYLVERYTITYLTSGRDLLRLQLPHESRNQPLVVAAPTFGEPALVPTGVAARPQVDYSQVFFGPLPGVGDEVRALKMLLPQATFLVGDQATEAALRRANGPRILHIATHGFFLRSDEAAPAGTSVANGAGTRLGRWAAWVENPLLRSGLAMAGANQGRSGDDDGVLTAFEAAGLDLWGTKLVVLSACDTGVGEVSNGEGVSGLRRALVLAGAESQLMSLWPVSDRSTRDLMIGYYRLLTQAEGRGQALRRAQLRMLGDPRHGHPYYWASFIQSGEWGNLDGRR